MKKDIGNIIGFIFILLFIIYVVIGITNDANNKSNIKAKGQYSYGIVKKINIGGRVGDSFTYTFYFDGSIYTDKNPVGGDYSRNHQIGDTIIIKFLPKDPTKSMIIEDMKYKSCMGLPPKKGWKELPKCKEDFHLVRVCFSDEIDRMACSGV
ncbi:MAG TPA: hypothetical protein VKX31_03280 [Brumimicrobium sp.]|nr:hypothetical protein [Brumimicrobium sp.]